MSSAFVSHPQLSASTFPFIRLLWLVPCDARRCQYNSKQLWFGSSTSLLVPYIPPSSTMSTDCLLPGYWNPDICVATSAMNQPRLFTHWIPKLQTLNERSLSQLRQQPTHSRLKFIDDYLEDARRGGEKEYAFVPLVMQASNTTAREGDKSTHSVLGEHIATRVASPSRSDPGSPSRHLPRLVTAALISAFPQSTDLDSPTTSFSGTSNLLSEAMVEDSCPPEYLSQRNPAPRDDPDVPNSGGVLSLSLVEI